MRIKREPAALPKYMYAWLDSVTGGFFGGTCPLLRILVRVSSDRGSISSDQRTIGSIQRWRVWMLVISDCNS